MIDHGFGLLGVLSMLDEDEEEEVQDRAMRSEGSKMREDLEQQLVRNHRHRRALIDHRSNHRHRRDDLLHP